MLATEKKPKYLQLADQLRQRIQQGELKPGKRLPSFAEMYREYGVTAPTMSRVYEQLEKEHLIERRGGSGVYIIEPRRPRTGNIGIIGSPSFEEQSLPYYVHIYQGMQNLARTCDYRLLIGTDEYIDPQFFEMIDGVILIGHSNDANQAFLRHLPLGIPCISTLSITDNLTSVVPDEYRAGKLAVQHLLNLGHRHIACLMTSNSDQLVRPGRYAGYLDALEEAGINPEEAWIRTDTIEQIGYKTPYLEWGREHMRNWISSDWHDLHCTAILAQNDSVGIGVIQALTEAGVRIPHDVSIIGFDGTEICKYVMPHLTSIGLPLYEVGRKSVECLIDCIEHKKTEAQIITLPPTLHLGASTSPPKQ